MSNEDEEFGARWDPDNALKGLSEEADVFSLTPRQLAKKILDENAPAAAQGIVNLALYSVNEKQRFEASKYILDRQFGRIPDPVQDDAELNPLEALLADTVTTVENYANGHPGS